MTRTTEDPPSLPPLDFNLVMERYEKARQATSRQEVEALLGPPTERNAWVPEIRELQERVENAGRNYVPSARVWDKWADPKDDGRWVVVLYADEYQANKVHQAFKKGF